MVFERIKFLATNVAPKPEETTYWVDTWANSYGGVIKYYNGRDWVKLDQLSVAEDYNRLRNKPTLNNVTIEGNKTSKDYDIPTIGDVDNVVNEFKSELGKVNNKIAEVTNKLNTYIETNDGNITEIKADITEIKKSLELLLGDSTSNIIDKFNEILSFLEGFNDTDKLKKILNDLELKLTTLMNNVVNNIKYNTALPEQLVTPAKVGGIKQGTTVKQLKGSSFISMFDRLLFEEVQPTVQNPSVSISVRGNWSNNGIYEVGAAAPSVEGDFTYTFNRGTCTVAGQPNKNRAGAETSHLIKLDEALITANTKIVLNEMRYTIVVNHGIGDELITSHGNKASIQPNPLPAGSVNSSVSVFGTYPYFCNGQSASSDNQDSNLPNSVTPDTKLPLLRWSDVLVGAKFASEASTGTRLEFKFPSIKNITKVEFFNTVSGKWELFAASNYTTSDAGNMSVLGQNVAYKKLTTQGAMSGALQLRFTLANVNRVLEAEDTYDGQPITSELFIALANNSETISFRSDDNLNLKVAQRSRPLGVANFAVNFEPGGQAPLDARTVVETKADLINAATYASKNYYQGMMVITKDTLEIYILKDVAKITSSDYSGWKRVDGGSVSQTIVDNSLTSSDATHALSAAMGKKLQDEKLAKTDVIDNLTDASTNKALSSALGKALNDKINSLSTTYATKTELNDGLNQKVTKTDIVNDLTTGGTTKVLSAEQGKVLNTKISSVGTVCRYKGDKTNIGEVVVITNAVIGDIWNVINEFTLNSKKYPAGTNVICVKDTSDSEHTEANWDPLSGSIDLSQVDVSSKVDKSSIKNDLTTGGATNVLSAELGKILKSQIDNLTNTTLKKSDKGVANGVAPLNEHGMIPTNLLPAGTDEVIDCYATFTKNPDGSLSNIHLYEDEAHEREIKGATSKIYIDITVKTVYNRIASENHNKELLAELNDRVIDDYKQNYNPELFSNLQLNSSKQTTFGNYQFRWTGTQFVVLNPPTVLGEVTGTAYDGGKGKLLWDNLSIIDANDTTNGSFRKADKDLENKLNSKIQTDINSAKTEIINGNVATATKLKNPVLLWGNQFDGSLSVNGDIAADSSNILTFKVGTEKICFSVFEENTFRPASTNTSDVNLGEIDARWGSLYLNNTIEAEVGKFSTSVAASGFIIIGKEESGSQEVLLANGTTKPLSELTVQSVESANKLTTPRKIFGQTFDGTADVKGDCSVTSLRSDLAILSGYHESRFIDWEYNNRDQVNMWLPGNEANLKLMYSGAGLELLRGSISAPSGFYEQSDIRLKTNIKPIDVKDNIELVEFNWKESGKHSYGVIAQQIEKSYPELVNVDTETGYKTVKYDSVLIVKCAQLEEKINKLEKLLEELKNGKNRN